MSKANDLITQGFKYAQVNSPEILTALGITGVASTAYLSVKSTFAAADKIMMAEIGGVPELPNKFEAKKKDRYAAVAKLVWTEYIPPAIAGAATMACIFGSHKAGARRTAAAVAAYSLSQGALDEYKAKAKQVFGEKKADEVQQEVVQDKVNANPPPAVETMQRSGGEVQMYDINTGRYFLSDVETLKKAETEVNRRLFKERYVSVKEFYQILGIWHGDTMERLGWEMPEPMELLFTPVLHEETQEPCLGFHYNYVKGL